MTIANYLPDVLETTEAERLATGFIFTEGPTWHPDGFWYFVDIRRNQLFKMWPGKPPEIVRTAIGMQTRYFAAFTLAVDQIAFEIERNGRRLRIVPDAAPLRLDRLVRRPEVVTGDSDDFVHLDWSSEWQE